MDKDEQILRKRYQDLATAADQRGICVFTDFLNLNEQNIFYSMKHELSMIKYFTYGGYSQAERKILCFCGDYDISDETDVDYPIRCVKIIPTNKKFSDTLTHRDFLGAILNLGLDRSKIGDILINENEGYLFCSTSISSFIADNLNKVKHTVVSCSLIEAQDFDYRPNVKELTGTVSSVRLDSILSVAFQTSRSSLIGLIEGGKVFVNGKEVISNSYTLKEQDIVSVRGMGKFIYQGTSKVTKKGRIGVKISLYV
ncbi:MAG: hypothetical protein K0S47_1691 [Herbinix sp.]|jgi:RNA-binding protein YlmH|nr:hypothetical protein [Herbinix sp.]